MLNIETLYFFWIMKNCIICQLWSDNRRGQCSQQLWINFILVLSSLQRQQIYFSIGFFFVSFTWVILWTNLQIVSILFCIYSFVQQRQVLYFMALVKVDLLSSFIPSEHGSSLGSWRICKEALAEQSCSGLTLPCGCVRTECGLGCFGLFTPTA